MQKCLFPLLILALLVTSCSEHKKNSVGPEQSQAILWNIPDIEADELDFGLVEENKSKILSLEIKNSSETILSGTPQVTGDESFKLIYTNCLNLEPNKKCSVKIGFKPLDNSLENRSGNLVYGAYTNLIFGAVNKLENEAIQFFNGSTPLSTLNLGQLNYNQSLIKTIKIVNSGDMITNYPLELSGDKFNLVYDQCSNKPLSPKKSCVFKLYATGLGQSGVIEDSVTYGDSELSLQLQVNNFETVRLFSNIQLFYNNSILDSILDLGTVNWKEFKLLNLNYKNSGDQAGEIGSISYDHNLYYDNCQNKILNPNGSCLIKLDLDTTSPGIFSKELSSLINGSVVSNIFQYQVRQSGEKINCSSQIPFADIAFITWTGSQYTNCIVEECLTNYTVVDNECLYIIPTAEDLNFNLTEDIDSGELDFVFTSITGNSTGEIVSGPSNGQVTVNGNKFTYIPNGNYHGSDSFTYRIFDGNQYSEVKTVTLVIAPVNDAPVSNNQSVETLEDNYVPITLVGTDVDGDTLTYTVLAGPSHGSLSGTAPNLTYTPSTDYNGSDSFTFKVNDGMVDSNTATVAITVIPVNDAPVLSGSSVLATSINNSNSGGFSVTDIDSSSFTYQVTQQGSKGVLTVDGGNNSFTYTPNLNQYGTDTVAFRAFDGTDYSNTLTISVTITGSGIIVSGDGSRTYFDGSVQKNCYDYRFTNSGAKTYTGSTGDGVYKIQSGSEVANVYCDMSTDGGGWTLVLKVGDYLNTSSYTAISTANLNPGGLTNVNVIGIGVTYSKLSNSMINAIRSSTATTAAAYRLEKVSGGFNGSYKKLFYPGACTFSQYGSNIASVAPWCTRRAETWNATTFASASSGVAWCNQPDVMSRTWFCSGTHEAFIIVHNYYHAENHNIPHHRLWVR